MAIILPHDLSSAAIRTMQEFRRLNAEILPGATLEAVRHPAGHPADAIAELIRKGFLTSSEEGYKLTQMATGFLAIEAKPVVAETSAAAASAAANPKADGV